MDVCCYLEHCCACAVEIAVGVAVVVTRYKIQDVYLGISSYPEWVVYRKMPEQVLLKSIKVCKYK